MAIDTWYAHPDMLGANDERLYEKDVAKFIFFGVDQSGIAAIELQTGIPEAVVFYSPDHNKDYLELSDNDFVTEKFSYRTAYPEVLDRAMTDGEAMFYVALKLATPDRPVEKVLDEIRACARLGINRVADTTDGATMLKRAIFSVNYDSNIPTFMEEKGETLELDIPLNLLFEQPSAVQAETEERWTSAQDANRRGPSQAVFDNQGVLDRLNDHRKSILTERIANGATHGIEIEHSSRTDVLSLIVNTRYLQPAGAMILLALGHATPERPVETILRELTDTKKPEAKKQPTADFVFDQSALQATNFYNNPLDSIKDKLPVKELQDAVNAWSNIAKSVRSAADFAKLTAAEKQVRAAMHRANMCLTSSMLNEQVQTSDSFRHKKFVAHHPEFTPEDPSFHEFSFSLFMGLDDAGLPTYKKLGADDLKKVGPRDYKNVVVTLCEGPLFERAMSDYLQKASHSRWY